MKSNLRSSPGPGATIRVSWCFAERVELSGFGGFAGDAEPQLKANPILSL